MDTNKEKPVVLIVDDNIDNLRVLIEYLDKEGFETFIAQNGEGAIRQVRYALPDIILLDIMMPGIDGYETCSQLKANDATKDIPVIFMSALTETVDKVRGFDAGAVDYIAKPFQKEEVLARINAHLTIQRQKKELIKLNDKLSESNATKDKFFSIIAHDLKGPFNGLIGGIETLILYFDKLETETVKKLLTHIQESSKNAFDLLNNLLEWSRCQTGRISCKPGKINLHDFASMIILLLEQNAKKKNIDIINNINKKNNAYADADMINSVMRNLLSNAIKFTHNTGTIELTSKESDTFVEISVTDTGVGINKEAMLKLFRIDMHYSSKGTAKEPGTGLGLILCKEFLEKNKGSIWAESEPGKGSKFTFRLPKFESK